MHVKKYNVLIGMIALNFRRVSFGIIIKKIIYKIHIESL